MTKLSPAQAAILRRMGEGGELCLMKGMSPYYWWWGRAGEGLPGIRLATVSRLYDLGLVEVSKSDWHSAIYVITPAGRTYLEGLE